jgi:hypothetical protein
MMEYQGHEKFLMSNIQKIEILTGKKIHVFFSKMREEYPCVSMVSQGPIRSNTVSMGYEASNGKIFFQEISLF